MGYIAARLARLAAVSAMSLAMAACSGTDVELKGGVFDLMGVSGPATKRTEPKMADRPGIVIPPSTASLPAPGDGQSVQASGSEAFPVNPEEAKKAQLASVVDQHKAFCDKARQRFEVGLTPALENSPWGACHESVLRNFSGKDLSGNKAVGKE